MRPIILYKIISTTVLTIFFSLYLTVHCGRVVSGSMEPTIMTGESVLYTKLVPFSKLAEGDIVLFEADISDKLIVHRIIGVQYDYDDNTLQKSYTTKGDNNKFIDTTSVTKQNYKGKVLVIVENEKINTLLTTISHFTLLTRIVVTLGLATIWFIITVVIENKLGPIEQPILKGGQDNEATDRCESEDTEERVSTVDNNEQSS